eukprot:15603751-Heterocapsa_arctica.AAC.1
MRAAELGNQHFSSFSNLFLSQSGACSIAKQLLRDAFGPRTANAVGAQPRHNSLLHTSAMAHTCPADMLLLRH